MSAHSACDQIPHPKKIPQVVSGHPGLASARILSSQFSKKLTYALSNFHPGPLTTFLGYKSPLVHAVFRIDPGSILRSLLPCCNDLTKIRFHHFNCFVQLRFSVSLSFSFPFLLALVFFGMSVWEGKKVLEIDGGDGCTAT